MPAHIHFPEAQQFLADLPGVTAVYDLHIWGMSTTESALTVQLIMPGGYPGDDFLELASAGLKQRYAIQHSTLQIRRQMQGSGCVLES